MKKWGCVCLAVLFGCSALLSQDLVEAAKKEKERRAQLKKRSTVVVTNATLGKPNREEQPRTAPPEEQGQSIPDKRQPSQQIDTTGQRVLRVDRAKQPGQLEARGFSIGYATQVLNANELVSHPDLALEKPDGRFAEIPLLGVLDLQITASNGPGEDIAVYAVHAGASAVAPGGEEEGGIPQIVADFYEEGLWYGVLGMEEEGEWVAIGKGSGMTSPEKFDLGSLSSVTKIRIMFKPFSNVDFPMKFDSTQSNDSAFRLDAVESLHR